MRLLLMFDMPTETTADRKAYRDFRKFILSEGFIMHQFSVYSKILLNSTSKSLLVERLKDKTPKKGIITLLSVTEKQFSKMEYLSGEKNMSIANSDTRVVFLGGDIECED